MLDGIKGCSFWLSKALSLKPLPKSAHLRGRPCHFMAGVLVIPSCKLAAGDDAKALVDEWVDACAAVINLRTAIMRYRKPRSSARFYRHVNAPHTMSGHLAKQPETEM